MNRVFICLTSRTALLRCRPGEPASISICETFCCVQTYEACRTTLYTTRLSPLWNWLPAFRAVAETENVHEASRYLHVTPSAVSRAVKLLESEVGVALFNRSGRNVRLTREGRV